MNKKIKNIIFDFNGTILDDLQVSFDALNACAVKFNDNKIITLEFYRNSFRFPVRPYYEELGFKCDDKQYAIVANYFIDYYRSRSNENKLFPGIKEILKTLNDHGYNVYLLSASYKPLLSEQLEYYGIKDLFKDVIAIENNHGGSKIDAAKAYFKNIDINEENTIYLGDTHHDAETAHELGVKAVLFSGGHNSYEFLLKANCPIVRTHKEFIEKFDL